MANATKVKGSKGCFAAGTLVSTPVDGSLESIRYVAIEELQVGDAVISYDHQGTAYVDVVMAVHHHEAEPVTKYTFWGDFELTATPSHWVLNQYGAFVPLGTLTADDCIVDSQNHLRPLLYVEDAGVEKVYNLTVANNRTFFANELCVHNQGTGARHPKVRGAKGKSGGGGRAAKEEPNSLRSRATIKVLDLVSQGEIYGLVDKANPLKSVFFDDTPLMNADGTLNYGNAVVQERVGTAMQTYVEGFPSANNPVQVGVEIKNGFPATRTVGSDYDAATVTIGVNSLFKTDKSTGDITGNTVGFSIQRKLTSSSTWQPVVAENITGKTMRPYERDYRIPRPGGTGTWDIRVTRNSADDVDSSVGSATTWNRYVERKDAKLAYENKAYVAVAADAESTGGNIPRRSFDVKGMLVRVPDNYNPETRAYTGNWTGTFSSTLQWTDNPAWVIYDMLTDPAYGLGEFINESFIDKFSFYDAARYNDQILTYKDANGVTKSGPRFTFNGVIQTQEEAWKLIQTLASNCNSFVGEAGGLITLIQDRPKNPVKLVTKSNVIDGKFNYTGSSMLARHTAVNVTFTDANDNYLPRTITEKLDAAVARYGYNPTDLAVFGCTDEAMARRAAKWVLETENTATELLNYAASWDHIDIVPGDIIEVQDPDYAGFEWGGRVKAVDVNNITLDRLVDHSMPGAYTIKLMDIDGKTIHSRVVNTWSVVDGVSKVNVANLPTTLAPETTWVLAGPVAPRQFRVISIRENKPGEFTVTAIFHDPTKYSRIEQGVQYPAMTYSGVGKTPPKVPTNLQVKEESYYDGQVLRRRLRFNWTTSANDYITRHAVKYSVDGKSSVSIDNIAQPELLLSDVTPGTYSFNVTSYNVVNVSSPTASINYTIANGTNGTPVVSSTLKAPVNVGVDNKTNTTRGTVFWTEDVVIGWDDPVDNVNMINGVNDVTTAYMVEFIRPDNTTMYTTTVNKPDRTFNWSLAMNSQKFSTNGVPTGTFKVRVFAVDAFGRMSPASATTTIRVLSMSTPANLNTANGLWDSADLTMSWDCFPIGNPQFNGVQVNTLKFFKNFKVDVMNGSTVLFTDYTTDNNYTLTLARNKALFGGPYKNITFRVMPNDVFGNTAPGTALATKTVITPPTASNLRIAGPVAGTDLHTTCYAATTDNIVLSGLQTVDGVPLSAGNRVLVKNQTNPVLNGIYTASSGTWSRASDMNTNGGVSVGSWCLVSNGTVNGGNYFVVTQKTGALGTGQIIWGKFLGGNVFSTKDVNLVWDCSYNGALYSTNSLFSRYVVTTDASTMNESDETYTYSFAQNALDHAGVAKAQFGISVRAVDVFGQLGPVVTNVFQAIKPPSVRNLALPNAQGYLFNTRDLGMVWNAEVDYGSGLKYSGNDLFVNYQVIIKQAGTSASSFIKQAPTESFTYTFTENATDFGGNASSGFGVRSLDVTVYATDVFGQQGGSSSATFTNPTPSAPGLSLDAGYSQMFFTLQPPTNEPDIAGYQVWVSKVNGFIPGDASSKLVYDGTDFFGVFLVEEPGVTYYAKAACYDSFGPTGLSFSPGIPFATLQDIKVPEYQFEGLTFTPAANGVSWTSGTAIRLAGAGETSNSTTTNTIGSGNSGAYDGNTMFIYYVWPETALRTSTSLQQVWSNGTGTTTILASWRGGTALQVGNGKAYMDGGYILAQTIGASQLVANSAVITGTAQIQNGVIVNAHISNAAIDNAKIADLTVETLKLKNGAITNITGVTTQAYNYGPNAVNKPIPTGQGSSSFVDSGWQTVCQLPFTNPPTTAGNGLTANCFVFFGTQVSSSTLSNTANPVAMWAYDNSVGYNAGTNAYRVVLEALDQNDGNWYVQKNNSYWPEASGRGHATIVFNRDDPTRFNGALGFRAIQNAVSGQASATTISQGSQYRPGQMFRLSLQTRTSIFTSNVSTSDTFSSTSWTTAVDGTTDVAKYPYKYGLLLDAGTGNVKGAVSAGAAPTVTTLPSDVSAKNSYLICQQVFK